MITRTFAFLPCPTNSYVTVSLLHLQIDTSLHPERLLPLSLTGAYTRQPFMAEDYVQTIRQDCQGLEQRKVQRLCR